ncbi:putative leucine-rich repeat-containing protein DDB_G0290503 [Battus philenor]|uniref:putative leucine-rich repeat-containing protein DDB_G0290503 n=1 Tax=Battus philenor TaxID=42288 RepID=UPI0035CED0FD
MKLSGTRAYISPNPVPKMPAGLVEIIEGLSREVLKNNPSDLFEFCAEHMKKLLILRDGYRKYISDEKFLKKLRAQQRRQKYDDLKNFNDLSQNGFKPDSPLASNTEIEKHCNDINVEFEDECTVIARHDNSFKSNDSLDSSEVKTIENKHRDKELKSNELPQTTTQESPEVQSEIKSHDEEIKMNVGVDILNENDKVNEDCLNVSDNHLVEVKEIENLKQDDIFDLSANDGKEKDIKLQEIETNKYKDTEANDKNPKPNIVNEIHTKFENTEISEINQNKDISEVPNALNENLDNSDNIENNVGQCEHVDFTVLNINGLNSTHETVINRKENNEESVTDVITEIKEANLVNNEMSEKNQTLKLVNVVDDDKNPIHGHNEMIDVSDIDRKAVNKDILEMKSLELSDLTCHKRDIEKTVDEETNKNNCTLTQTKKNNSEEFNETLNQSNDINSIELEKKFEEVGVDLNVEPSTQQNLSITKLQASYNDQNIESSASGHDITDELSIKESNQPNTDINLTQIRNSGLNDEYKISEINTQDDECIKTTNEFGSIVDHDHYVNVITDETKNEPNKTQEIETEDSKNSKLMDMETAAITIQKVFRNFLFKSKTSSYDDPTSNEFNIYEQEADVKLLLMLEKGSHQFGFYFIFSIRIESEDKNQCLNKDRRNLGISRIDTVLQTVNEEKSLSLSTDDSSTISSAATVIQAHVRGFLVRNKLNRKTISNTTIVDPDDSVFVSFEADPDINKNKTVLNIHIVPEGDQHIARDESLLTSEDLSLDSSPPASANLHPLGYDKSERRKQLKREDAVQSISPPSNNSKLSEENDSVKEALPDENIIKCEKAEAETSVYSHYNVGINDDDTINRVIAEENNLESAEITSNLKNEAPETSNDETDVVTPFIAIGEKISGPKDTKLLHSGEFHDLVLPTKVSRNDTSVVSGE